MPPERDSRHISRRHGARSDQREHARMPGYAPAPFGDVKFMIFVLLSPAVRLLYSYSHQRPRRQPLTGCRSSSRTLPSRPLTEDEGGTRSSRYCSLIIYLIS
jgi:hypothetical protein